MKLNSVVDRLDSLVLANVTTWFSLGGAGLSGLLASDASWLEWHFSRLGEGSGFSASVFNGVLIVSAVLSLLLGFSVKLDILKMVRSGKVANIVFGLFATASVGLMGISVFTFDNFSALHNIFGYLMSVAYFSLFIITPILLPSLRGLFSRYSLSIAIIIPVVYSVFFFFRAVPLVLVELVAYLLLYVWIILLVQSIRKRSKHSITLSEH